jgi:hypothetical protein
LAQVNKHHASDKQYFHGQLADCESMLAEAQSKLREKVTLCFTLQKRLRSGFKRLL